MSAEMWSTDIGVGYRRERHVRNASSSGTKVGDRDGAEHGCEEYGSTCRACVGCAHLPDFVPLSREVNLVLRARRCRP